MTTARVSLTEEFGDAFSGRRALVTGATGFIGWHLASALVELGAEVHALARSAQQGSVPVGCKAWGVDLANLEPLRQAFRSVRPDIVYHVASVVDGRQDRDLVLPTLQANLVGAVQLALACDEAGCGHIVAVGSSEERDGEGASAVPASPYAAAKTSASLYFRMFHRLFGLPVVLVRPFMTYGPRQAARKLIPYTIAALLRGEAPRLSSGSRVCDFVFVTDVVRGLLRAGLAHDTHGETFDLGTAIGTPVRDVVELVVELSGSAARPVFGAVPDRPGERPLVANGAPARARLGWEPCWSLRDGLTETIAWHREHAA